MAVVSADADNDGVWGDLQFQLEGGSADADWLVVFDEPSPSLRTATPIERRILFISEPPGVKVYPSRYVNQFGVVVSPFSIPGFRGRALIQQSALAWHYGVDQRGPAHHATALQWGALAADKPKSKLASVICSSKAFLPHHRQRFAFVERLKTRLADRIDVFGRGLRPIDDKQEAIANYKYHIALENNVIDHSWTEKLADPYLGDAFRFSPDATTSTPSSTSGAFAGSTSTTRIGRSTTLKPFSIQRCGKTIATSCARLADAS